MRAEQFVADPRSHYLARLDENDRFPFEAWAREVAFPYRREFVALYRRCGSAAEAFFVRPFTERETCTALPDGSACDGRLTVTLQHEVKAYRADVLVTDGHLRLAIEIDGMAFHHRTKEQVAADYLRQRRIVARGYTVIRFTASEAFGSAAECWRQVDAIFDVRSL